MLEQRSPSHHEKDKASGLDGGHSDAVLSLLTLTGEDGYRKSCKPKSTILDNRKKISLERSQW